MSELRLDKEDRRLRFAHFVSDTFIDDYASRMTEFGMTGACEPLQSCAGSATAGVTKRKPPSL
jgi:hypothetical protein